ncbi:hypothetical protein CNO18_05365 [Gordonia sp. 1D]|nr:hypothetical protein CNO18_05365 [Gordonia sp. 1D]
MGSGLEYARESHRPRGGFDACRNTCPGNPGDRCNETCGRDPDLNTTSEYPHTSPSHDHCDDGLHSAGHSFA